MKGDRMFHAGSASGFCISNSSSKTRTKTRVGTNDQSSGTESEAEENDSENVDQPQETDTDSVNDDSQVHRPHVLDDVPMQLDGDMVMETTTGEQLTIDPRDEPAMTREEFSSDAPVMDTV